MQSTIVISYGMPKSASTFAWMLLKQILIEDGDPIATLSPNTKNNHSKEDFVLSLEDGQIDKIAAETNGGSVVLKTHAAAHLFEGFDAPFDRSFVFVQYRDPREIALSLIDHGARTRAKGIPDFADCDDHQSTFKYIDAAFDCARSWMRKDGAVAISYDELCFDSTATIERVGEILGIDVDPQRILHHFADTSTIYQFNKGVQNRWQQELSVEESNVFLERYSDYFENGIYCSHPKTRNLS